METLFLLCAVIGGTMLLLQVALQMLGLGHHDADADTHDAHDVGHDVAHDHHGHSHSEEHSGSSWFAGLLTFRTVIAGLTFFGLAGMAGAVEWGAEDPRTILVAFLAGAAALFMVSALMRSLSRLKAEGTVRIQRAVGSRGTVYLTVPANKTGVGKVHLTLQNRTVEYQAITAHDALPTGTRVVVLSVLSADTVEVGPLVEAPVHESRTGS